MISSTNTFSGLSAADIQKLFSTDASSTSSSAASTSSVQPTSMTVSAAGASNSTNAVQAVLTQAHVERAGAATSKSIVSATVEAAYASQAGDSSSFVAVSVAVSSSDVSQSIESPQWQLNAATEAAYSAVAMSSASGPKNGTAAFSAQERLGPGATNPWGGGLAVSVLGEEASAANLGTSRISTSASVTFNSLDLYQRIISGGGSTVTIAKAAYGAQTGSSSSLGSENVTLSLPNTAQQVAYAVTQINESGPWTQTQAAPNDQGIMAYTGRVSVTATDAVNVTIADGAISLTGDAQAAALPKGIPSLANIQQAIGRMATNDPQSYPARTGLDPTAYEGSLTLVKLPANTNYAVGDNMVVFSTSGHWNFDTDDKWALVLPQDTVTVTVSDTQINTYINQM